MQNYTFLVNNKHAVKFFSNSRLTTKKIFSTHAVRLYHFLFSKEVISQGFILHKDAFPQGWGINYGK